MSCLSLIESRRKLNYKKDTLFLCTHPLPPPLGSKMLDSQRTSLYHYNILSKIRVICNKLVQSIQDCMKKNHNKISSSRKTIGLLEGEELGVGWYKDKGKCIEGSIIEFPIEFPDTMLMTLDTPHGPITNFFFKCPKRCLIQKLYHNSGLHAKNQREISN